MHSLWISLQSHYPLAGPLPSLCLILIANFRLMRMPVLMNRERWNQDVSISHTTWTTTDKTSMAYLLIPISWFLDASLH